MILDVKFIRDGLVLPETNLVLPDDERAEFVLSKGRASLQVQIWLDAEGLVFVAGPFMDHAMTARWRGRFRTDNRWHAADPLSNFTRQPWKCRYRIFLPRPRTRSKRSPVHTRT